MPGINGAFCECRVGYRGPYCETCKLIFNSEPDDKISDCSTFKVFADDNFTFDENGRILSKRVENTVGKGEIARYEQFLLFPQCFQKTYTADT